VRALQFDAMRENHGKEISKVHRALEERFRTEMIQKARGCCCYCCCCRRRCRQRYLYRVLLLLLVHCDVQEVAMKARLEMDMKRRVGDEVAAATEALAASLVAETAKQEEAARLM
jgi:hypothetical protein